MVEAAARDHFNNTLLLLLALSSSFDNRNTPTSSVFHFHSSKKKQALSRPQHRDCPDPSERFAQKQRSKTIRVSYPITSINSCQRAVFLRLVVLILGHRKRPPYEADFRVLNLSLLPPLSSRGFFSPPSADKKSHGPRRSPVRTSLCLPSYLPAPDTC